MDEIYYGDAEDVGYVVIMVTTPGPEPAKEIAMALVEAEAVACVSIIDKITSIFRWKGKVEQETECLLIIKTRAERVEEVIQKVKSLHSYDVPEIIALPIVDGNPSYLKWIDEVT
jgi:periplasmic divalent cation tolerance protein